MMRRFLLFGTMCALMFNGCRCLSTKTTLHEGLIKDTLIKELRTKSWLWEWMSNDTHTMIGDVLYVDDDQWEALIPSAGPTKDLLAHELKHAERQQKHGVWSWVIKYIFDYKFRFEEEMIAFEAGWRSFYARDGLRFSTQSQIDTWANREAKRISGSAYFYMVEHKIAFNRIKMVLRKIYEDNGREWPKK